MNNRDFIDGIIGFDFGSSSSKVVVNFPSYDLKVAIDFSDYVQIDNPCLIPTKIFKDQDGNLTLDSRNHVLYFEDFKTFLTDKSQDICDKAEGFTYSDISIAYIGLVLRIVKSMKNDLINVPQKIIRWFLNVGIPSNNNNDFEIRKTYRKICNAAWYISETTDPVSKQLINQSKIETNWQFFKTSNKDYINLAPEIAAEVVGFAKSKYRKDGLYVMIDIGSRTLDIASFNLHSKDGDDHYSFLTANISELGTFYLHEERMKQINNQGYLLNSEIKKMNIINKLPDFREYFLIQNRGIDEIKILQSFMKEVRTFIISTFIDLRKKRYPNAPEWKEGLPVFICGGGKNSLLYNYVIKLIDDTYIREQIRGKLLLKKIPEYNLNGLKNKKFDRIAVAYGLSHNIFDFGIIQTPDDFKDIIDKTFQEDNLEDELDLKDEYYL